MIQPGNQKLGPGIWGWSILAGDTCPGASGPCTEDCYAMKNRFLSETVIASHTRNWRFSELDGFAKRMCEMIARKRSLKTLRVHVAGDFYDPIYTEKWIDIVIQNRQTDFYAYTRSWRIEDIYPSLLWLAAEPNFQMWFSCDMATGRPPVVPGVYHAYMAVSDFDVPDYPVDLVFRVNRKTVMKWDDANNLVCPVENGVTKTDCSRCGLCWSNCRLPKRSEEHDDTERAGRRNPLGQIGNLVELQLSGEYK